MTTPPGGLSMATGRRTQLTLSESDRKALELIKERYSQSSEAGAVRLCIKLVASSARLALDFGGMDGEPDGCNVAK